MSTETPLGKAARSARSTFSTMAATLPLCGYRASRPTFGSSIGSQAMVACTAAPWPGADGTRERQPRFSNAYDRSAPVSVAGLPLRWCQPLDSRFGQVAT